MSKPHSKYFRLPLSTLSHHQIFTEGHCVKIVRIRSFSGPYFSYLSWIQRDAPHLSVFSLNAGKYVLELLRIGTLFTQWELKLFLLIRFQRLSSFKLCKFQFSLTLCAEESMKYHRNISSQWLNSTYYSNKRSLPPSLMKT